MDEPTKQQRLLFSDNILSIDQWNLKFLYNKPYKHIIKPNCYFRKREYLIGIL